MYPNTKYNDLSHRDLLPHIPVPSSWSLIDSNVSVTGTLRAEVTTISAQSLAICARQSSCCELSLQCADSADVTLVAIPLPEPEEKQIANSL